MIMMVAMIIMMVILMIMMTKMTKKHTMPESNPTFSEDVFPYMLLSLPTLSFMNSLPTHHKVVSQRLNCRGITDVEQTDLQVSGGKDVGALRQMIIAAVVCTHPE